MQRAVYYEVEFPDSTTTEIYLPWTYNEADGSFITQTTDGYFDSINLVVVYSRFWNGKYWESHRCPPWGFTGGCGAYPVLMLRGGKRGPGTFYASSASLDQAKCNENVHPENNLGAPTCEPDQCCQ